MIKKIQMKKNLLLILVFAFTAASAQITYYNINSVAGNGSAGYSGDYNPNDSVLFDTPHAVAVDDAGNIYIADTYNNRIRKKNISTGKVSTIAGTGIAGFSGDNGLAVLAMINNPTGIALDTAGNIYIADQGNNRIRKINIATGKINTAAGNGVVGYSGDGAAATLAKLNSPTALALDSTGNIYIADYSNHCIRKVTKATGKITTIAGTGNAGYSGDAAAANLAELNNPGGVAVDDIGNVFVADQGNYVIRKISAATGNISTFAGTGSQGFSGDGAAATSADLDSPSGVAVDTSGNVYITELGNRVRIVTIANGNINTVAGTGTANYSGDGSLSVSAEINSPFSSFVAENGDLYIADTYNYCIRKVKASDGKISTVAGEGGTSGYLGDALQSRVAALNYQSAVISDAAGNIYMVDQANNRIRKINSATGYMSTVAGTGNPGLAGDGGLATLADLDGPTGIAVDAAGNLYITDSNNHIVRKVNASDGKINTIGGTAGLSGFSGDGALATVAKFDTPTGIALDANGNIFIADLSNNRIRKIDAGTGNISTFAGSGTAGFSGDGAAANLAKLNGPSAIAIDANGDVYIADTQNSRVRKVNASDGNISTVAGNGTAGYTGDGNAATSAALMYPEGVATDALGNIFISDTDNNCIRKVNSSDNKISTIAGTGISGYSGDGGLGTSAKMYYPKGIATDAGGSVLVADQWNNRVRKLDAFVGIAEAVAENINVNIYPNPVSEQLTISIAQYTKANTYVFVYNVSGETVKQMNSSQNKFTMNTTDLADGIYFLEIRNGSAIARRKLIVEN